MNYRVINKDEYYRKGVYRHFTEDCKCSVSMTARIDVTELVLCSKNTGTKFYLNFLYVLSKVLNSRDDYKMSYNWQTDELICYDQINPTQYVFHEDTETCTPVYTTYNEDYKTFYDGALADLNKAKETREYALDAMNHPNWFDASYISWLSYDSLNIELPDGYLYFIPIINWGRYREENGRLMMPVTVRLNHAVADGYLVANVFRLLEKEMSDFYSRHNIQTTERLILRRWEESDAPEMFKYTTDPDIGPITGWPPHKDIEESKFIINNVLNTKEAYAICLKDDGKPIGAVELKLKGNSDKIENDDECELGYWLGKPYWGQGIMPEACRELVRHAFEDLGMKKIWLGYYDGNDKSRRVAEKLGFKYDHYVEKVDVPLLMLTRSGHVHVYTREDWLNSGK